MRDWKRWTAVLLAGSLAFTAADDMKLIVQAYEMQTEQGQESYQAQRLIHALRICPIWESCCR